MTGSNKGSSSSPMDAGGGDAGNRRQPYLAELEALVDRINSAATHYDVLGAPRSADMDGIKAAYVALLRMHPKSRHIDVGSQSMQVRVDRAFARVMQAFSVLSDYRARAQYDGQTAPPPLSAVREPRSVPAAAAEPPPAPGRVRPAGAGPERRRDARVAVPLPARVTGYHRESGQWTEETFALDENRLGIAVHLREAVRVGNIVHVSAPVPARLRRFGFTDVNYDVYAIVRRAEPVKDGNRVVGLEFVGQSPPAAFHQKPWGQFHTAAWQGPNRRREPHVPLEEPFRSEFLDGDLHRLGEGRGLSETVSSGGIRLIFKTAPPDCEFVRVTRLKSPFVSLAVVRNRFPGKDGQERLCVQFIEKKFPL